MLPAIANLKTVPSYSETFVIQLFLYFSMDLKSISNSAFSEIHSKCVEENFVLVILALSANFETKQIQKVLEKVI
jgi:hypothetical protein